MEKVVERVEKIDDSPKIIGSRADPISRRPESLRRAAGNSQSRDALPRD